MNRKTVALAAIIVSALLTGCNKPKTSEEAVTARIDSRYAALIAQDYKKPTITTPPAYAINTITRPCCRALRE